MKKRALLIPVFGIFAYLTLSSDSNGPGGNKTGSRGVTAGCATCHGGTATAGVTIAFELDSAGTPVTRYKPGMLYTLKMTGTNTTANSLPKFGTQLSVVSGSGSSSVNAGTFSSLPTGTSTITSSTIKILQHNTKLSPATGTGATGTTYVVSVGWTAPAAGTGTVTAYGVINAVDNNGGDNTADKWNNATASFTELPNTIGVASVSAAELNIYPNPVVNMLNIGAYTGSVIVYDINGKIVTTAVVNNNITIDASSWTAGMYLVVLNNGERTITRTIVKN